MFTLIDAVRLLVATLLGGAVIALPGVALARGFCLSRRDGIVAGLAVLPLVDSLGCRFLGLDTAAGLTLVLAACGAVLLLRAWRDAGARPSRSALALCATWFALVVFEWVDFDVAGQLFQPLSVIDAVKHAATTQAIVDTGAPPRDPFFLRPERVSYYYFFYMLPALVERLGLGLVDARAAVGGCAVWTGLGLYGLVSLAMERAGILERRRCLLVVAVLAAGGLDIIGVLRLGLLQHTWLEDPVGWNEQIMGWFESLVWVPHHVTALIAAMLGLMALAGPAGDAPTRAGPARVGLAALCFASTLGLSVWVTLALVATVALWGVALLVERRWRTLGDLTLAGGLALLLAARQIHDLVAGRAGTGSAAIAFTVRAFTPIDGLVAPGPWRLVARALALPFNYFAGAGVLALGTALFRQTRGGRATEFGRVLALAAIAGLVLGAFWRSTLFNNDLGWRVLLFPLLAGVVWTVAALERLLAAPQVRRAPAFLLVLLCLGWATTAYAVVSLRTYPWTSKGGYYAFMYADPATERALRGAYGWADANLPAGAVLQHDPTRSRAFDFALYGSHPVAVADGYGSLFGADTTKVARRIAALAPIFAGTLPAAEVRSRALAAGIDDIVVSAADPVFAQADGFARRAVPAYASARVRIIPVAALAGLSDAPGKSAAAALPEHGG